MQARLATQRRLLAGAQALSHATDNRDVIQRAQADVRHLQQSIEYLEENLRALQRRSSLDVVSVPASQSAGSGLAVDPAAPTAADERRGSMLPPGMPIDSSAAYRGVFVDSEAAAAAPAPARQYTPLELLKYDTPLTSAKVKRLLKQLEVKLELENQYKAGFDKIARLYAASGDRRSHADAERRASESAMKLRLIQQALKHYRQLDVRFETEDPSTQTGRRPRKPQTGTLSISVLAARDMDHAPVSSGLRGTRDAYVAIKIEDTERVQTHVSRSDTWNESFELPLDNTSEVELIVYERVGGASPTPIGLLWLRISDIVDQLRKIKSGQVGDAALSPSPVADGWLTAEGLRSGSTASSALQSMPSAQLAPSATADTAIDGWFALAPKGALQLRLNFVKHNVQKRPLEARLGRQGALRKRREDVAEVNGHKFVPRQFYQMIRCALCGELLLNAAGSQCEECNYTCHRKCAQKVVTKCISMGTRESERDEVKIKHRIPHRFEPFTNLTPSWCCHCGYMLPLGRRSNRRCSECDLTCHADCAHLVPDFCGMTMGMANELLSNLATINKSRAEPKVEPPLASMQAMTVADTPRTAAVPAAPAPMPAQPPPSLALTTPASAAVAPTPLAPVTPSPAATSPARSSPAPPMAAGVAPPTSVAAVSAPPPVYPESSDRKVSLNDFNFLAVLGKGNFGKVMLAEEKHTGQLFAIKVLKKEFIIENDEIDSTRSEKRVFLVAARERHPFLLLLHSCFQTETRVYFVMEYVGGGDLMLHIQREQFNLHRAKFYAAEVLLALEFFHRNGIIYRDLKLDNIMLTLDGHIKIADYGLCKENMWYGSTTSTFCGTPEFMAPEILLEQRYSRAVDWWAFGILLYEMLLGQAPFRGDDEDEIFDAILEDEPLYPIQMPRDSVSLLQRLLTRNPARRLGAGPTDAEEVKAHPFFRDVNWDDLLHKRVPPPFLPTLKNASDTSWFDTEVRPPICLANAQFTSEKPTLTPVHSVFSAADQAEFRDFSWCVGTSTWLTCRTAPYVT